MLVAVTAPSLMGVPFGVVPRLSGLTRVSDGPADFTLPFPESVHCHAVRAVAGL